MKDQMNRKLVHLQFLYNRLLHVHGENENYDYMLRFAEIIKELNEEHIQLKEAFADYSYSEGCSCCESAEDHEAALDRIAKLLGYERYSDDSGWDVTAHSPIRKRRHPDG